MTRRAVPLLIALWVVAPVAGAEDVEGARAAFRQGAALAQEGRWNDALAQFERSVAMRLHATTLYDLGFCERALGHATRAKKYFDRALARDASTAGAELSPELRAATERYLVEVTAKIATPRFVVTPPDATVSVDGRPLEPGEPGDRLLAGTRPPGPGEKLPTASAVVEIDAGPHEIVITAPDGRSRLLHVELATGASREVLLELPPLPRAPPLDVGAPRRTASFVVGGVGLLAIGFGTYFGLHARSLWGDAQSACPGSTACPTEDGYRLSSSAKADANASTILFTVGVTAVAGGALLYLTAPRAPSVHVGVGLGGVELRGEF